MRFPLGRESFNHEGDPLMPSFKLIATIAVVSLIVSIAKSKLVG